MFYNFIHQAEKLVLLSYAALTWFGIEEFQCFIQNFWMKELLPTNTADSNNATDRLHQNGKKNDDEKELRCERKKNNFLQKEDDTKRKHICKHNTLF